MIRTFLIGFLAALSAAAQTGTQPKPTGGGGAVPLPTPTVTRNPTITNLPTTNSDPSQNRTIFISGKVVLEDGTAPPESVLIERLCGSTRRAETRTDLKGHFSFQIGNNVNNLEQMMDVSSDSGSNRPSLSPNANGGGLGSSRGGGRNSNELRGCELRAVLPGYQSSIVNLSMHSQFDSPDIGLIILKRMAGRDGDTISMTNALAPKDAKKAYDKARQMMAKGNVADARKELTKAVDIYPKYASAWADLGRIQLDASEVPAARQSFEKALEADPKYLPPHERLSVIALRDRNWEELADRTNKLLKLNSYDFPQAYYYNALAQLNLNHPDLAEKSARLALKNDPQKFARAGYVLGLALAQQSNFRGAAEQLKTYLAAAPPANETDIIKKQLVDIEKLATQQTAAKEPE